MTTPLQGRYETTCTNFTAPMWAFNWALTEFNILYLFVSNVIMTYLGLLFFLTTSKAQGTTLVDIYMAFYFVYDKLNILLGKTGA